MSTSLHDKVPPDPDRTGAGNISLEHQTWDFNADVFCRLGASESVVLKNEKHHLLIIDGGTAKFLYERDNTVLEVLDLNPYIIGIDLKKQFLTRSLDLAFQEKKPPGGPPVLNRHGLWADSIQNRVYIQAGQFYNAPLWNESAYFVPKYKIPPYTIWAFDVMSKQWEDITKDVKDAGAFNRTWGGASLSIPKLNESFHLGGLVTNRTSSTSPNGTFTAQGQFLHFNHNSNVLSDRRFYKTPDVDGYWHGSLTYIPVGPKGSKGWLISLMSQKGELGKPFPDKPVENDEFGSDVRFDKIWLYNLDDSTWHQQKTTWFSSDPPPVRTRYCTALVQDEKAKTWDLWIYGGQLPQDDQLQGVGDAWVLNIPSFIWTRIPIPLARLVNIRSMNCHAIGGQLLIVGGFPPGKYLHPNTSCDQELVKVLNLNGPTWDSEYNPNSQYHTPAVVRVRTGIDPPVKWADDSVRTAFEPREVRVLRREQIAGIVVGVIAFILAVLFFLRWRRKRKLYSKPTTPPHPQENPGQNPIEAPVHEMPVVGPPRSEVHGSVSTAAPTEPQIPVVRSPRSEVYGSVSTAPTEPDELGGNQMGVEVAGVSEGISPVEMGEGTQMVGTDGGRKG